MNASPGLNLFFILNVGTPVPPRQIYFLGRIRWPGLYILIFKNRCVFVGACLFIIDSVWLRLPDFVNLRPKKSFLSSQDPNLQKIHHELP